MVISAYPVPYATRVEEARSGRGEDRVTVVRLPGRTVIAVADGAGGVAGGASAAERVCAAAVEACRRGLEIDWAEWLAELDRHMAAAPLGLAAVVVVELSDDGQLRGASVGDCEAWVLGGATTIELTSRQTRTPLIGDGAALPVAFATHAAGGTVLAATDGLWKYAKHERIAAAAAARPLDAAAAALVELVRLRSGAFQDDVALAICSH
jgi:serine/threonine protein phosphatase PrpC